MDGEGDAARFRFSLRGLLLATAAVAVMAAPVSWLGEIYAASLATSLLMLGLVSLALWRKSTLVAVLACLSGFVPIPAFFAQMFFSPAAVWQMFLTPMAVVATHAWRERPARRIIACASLMAFVYGYALWDAADRHQRIVQLREEHQPISIAGRLPKVSRVKVHPVALTGDQDRSLSSRESSNRWGRADRLEELHNDRVSRFATAVGFGVTRMRYLPIESPEYFAAPSSDATVLPYRFMLVSSDPASLLYQRSGDAFLEAERTGYARSVNEVFGFASHAFTRPPDQPPYPHNPQMSPIVELRLDRLELISLLLHDEPVVYVSETLPDMEELRGAPTRELNEFELASLEELRGASDLEIDEEKTADGKRIRMVGALRAGKDCAACHDAPRGALLGAFSYDLAELAATTATR